MQTTPPLWQPAALRHPLDPDPVRSSKARAVFVLGLVAAVTGPCVGGVVPATVAMLLARQARREAVASGGYLTGAALIRRGELLAGIGLLLAASVTVAAVVIGVIRMVGAGVGHDFAPNFD
ncbi:MAG TPA: hypothetical protein VF174_10660 [Micromonosporaceae bacterium]